ncbi:glutamyl-tRNA reductase [Marinicrinis sediminis]|uniref:Glutamyl-tRNA reductase n=1 Tax=Marinicrinis sediminis TaxID=1652465 RepID=A0ABW5R712_9BACL
MHILAVGLNYRTAPVEIREKFSLPEQRLTEALGILKQTKSILECVIVSTCNRTEIYAVVDRMQVCGYHIRTFMENWFGIPREQFTQHLYIYEDHDAIEHLFKVTSGLDSMVIGETQILGQVRDAFLTAQQQKATGTLFNMLFKQGITLAKRAHSETSIGENAVSVSYAAVELAKRIFGHFQNKHVLIVGAGKMSELTVKYMVENGANQVTVVNRTVERAEELASRFQGKATGMDRLQETLADADIVISSTGSKQAVLTRDEVEQAMRNRKARPIFFIDIAVPRDIDPDVHHVENVFLYDIDDLEGIVESNLEQRKQEAAKIYDMIHTEILAFEQWYKTLGVTPVIRALQEKAARIHQETMESMFNKLPDLDEREKKVIRKLTKSIVNQMMHDPILNLKEMATDKNSHESIELFTKFFALEDVLESREEKLALANRQFAEKKQRATEIDKPVDEPQGEPKGEPKDERTLFTFPQTNPVLART